MAVCITFVKKEINRKDVGKDVGKDLSELLKNIILELDNNRELTILELSIKLNVTQRTIERSISKLKTLGYIKRIGGRKQGYWEILKK